MGIDGADASARLLEHGVAATQMQGWGGSVAERYIRFVFSNEPVDRIALLGERARARCKPDRATVSTLPPHPATDDLVRLAAEFQRDGGCVVRGLFDDAEVRRLRGAVERNLAEPSERAIEGGGDASSGRFFEDFRNWTRIADYGQVIRGSRLGEVAARLMGSRWSACTTTTCS